MTTTTARVQLPPGRPDVDGLARKPLATITETFTAKSGGSHVEATAYSAAFPRHGEPAFIDLGTTSFRDAVAGAVDILRDPLFSIGEGVFKQGHAQPLAMVQASDGQFYAAPLGDWKTFSSGRPHLAHEHGIYATNKVFNEDYWPTRSGTVDAVWSRNTDAVKAVVGIGRKVGRFDTDYGGLRWVDLRSSDAGQARRLTIIPGVGPLV